MGFGGKKFIFAEMMMMELDMHICSPAIKIYLKMQDDAG